MQIQVMFSWFAVEHIPGALQLNHRSWYSACLSTGPAACPESGRGPLSGRAAGARPAHRLRVHSLPDKVLPRAPLFFSFAFFFLFSLSFFAFSLFLFVLKCSYRYVLYLVHCTVHVLSYNNVRIANRMQDRYGDLDSRCISFGPCQTPTLGFCVARHDRIQSFSPETYYVLSVQVELPSGGSNIKLGTSCTALIFHTSCFILI